MNKGLGQTKGSLRSGRSVGPWNRVSGSRPNPRISGRSEKINKGVSHQPGRSLLYSVRSTPCCDIKSTPLSTLTRLAPLCPLYLLSLLFYCTAKNFGGSPRMVCPEKIIRLNKPRTTLSTLLTGLSDPPSLENKAFFASSRKFHPPGPLEPTLRSINYGVDSLTATSSA